MSRSKKSRKSRTASRRLTAARDRSVRRKHDRRREAVLLAHLAENRMDLAEALTILDGLDPGEARPDGWLTQLGELVALGHGAEPWRLAKWLGDAATRWALLWPDESVPSLAWAFADGRWGQRATTEHALSAVHDHPWVIEAALFDLGLFDSYLGRVAPMAAVEAAWPVRDWCAQPVRLLRCLSVGPRELRFADVYGPGEFGCHPVPGPPTLEVGDRLLARLLPVPGEPGYLSIVPGILVDEEHASAPELASAEARLRWLGGWISGTPWEKAARAS